MNFLGKRSAHLLWLLPLVLWLLVGSVERLANRYLMHWSSIIHPEQMQQVKGDAPMLFRAKLSSWQASSPFVQVRSKGGEIVGEDARRTDLLVHAGRHVRFCRSKDRLFLSFDNEPEKIYLIYAVPLAPWSAASPGLICAVLWVCAWMRMRGSAVPEPEAGVGVKTPPAPWGMADWGAALLLVACVASLIWNMAHQNVSRSHDPGVHAGLVLQILGELDRPSFNVPWYYLMVALFSLQMKLFELDRASVVESLSVSADVANFVLVIVMIAGLYLLVRRCGGSRALGLFAGAVAIGLPVMQRSWCMLRPENLQAVLLPWLFWCGLRLWERPSSLWRQVACLAVAGFFATQKGLGIPVVGALGAVCLVAAWWRGRLMGLHYLRLGILLGVVCAVLLVAAKDISGRWQWDHDGYRSIEGRHRPPLAMFVDFSPAKVWATPCRNDLKGSFWNIAAADAFGDYWLYGCNHSGLDRPREEMVKVARRGIVLCIGFSIASVFLTVTAVRAQETRWKACWLLLVSSVSLAALFASFYAGIYDPKDTDCAKLEYVLWLGPCAALLSVAGISVLSQRWAAWAGVSLAGIILAGLINTLYPGTIPMMVQHIF